eukprot:TRINITY_DN8365_c0_g1_i1.p1 TRINITY_DN8365_c0_g1~~TRINITY_DN8365_c0_g1_i1.p1  ORF type:complete len:589 (+),score=125.51 TRINITY_DN8365_c0_g1_i1:143-1909(+)
MEELFVFSSASEEEAEVEAEKVDNREVVESVDANPVPESCKRQASSPQHVSPVSPAKRRCVQAPAEQSDSEGSQQCEFSFEGYDSDEDFIPRGAKLTRPALLGTSPSQVSAGPKRQPLPSRLQAILPTEQLSAPRELEAAHLLTPEQSRAVQLVAAGSQPKSEAAEHGLRRRLAKYGYSQDALRRVLAYIRDEAPIIIHIDLGKRLMALRKDSHYRNRFETNCTSGSADIEKRKAWENRLFSNIYENVQAFDRVKYGVLNAVNDPRGIATVAKQYGEDYLVLRSVRLRTTFSDRDSCNQGQVASCEWYAHVLEKYSDIELRAVAEVALGDRLFVDSTVLDTADGGYKEVQIHGELQLSKHIEAVVIHPSRRNTKLGDEIKAWCKDIDVKLEFMPESCDGNPCDNLSKAIGAKLPAESPLWRWRPCQESLAKAGLWLRFDAMSCATLEAMRSSEAVQAPQTVNPELLPKMPVGKVSFTSLSTMAMTVLVEGIEVKLSLERLTAGRGARERDTNARDRPFVWEWCASASGHSAWCQYDEVLSAAIEAAWRNQRPRAMLVIGGTQYNVDFDLMVQVNCATKYRRLVRRQLK